MGGDDRVWRERFGHLFAPRFIDYARADVAFEIGEPADELISRLHCVAVNGEGRVIVCRSTEGWRFLPGGTREPGESLADLVARELMEEAGARVWGEVLIFAGYRATSHNDHPYRPHMPHPVAYWAFGAVRAEIVGPPTNPDDGEHVVEVLTLPVDQACAYVAGGVDPMDAEPLRLAEAMGVLDPERMEW